MKASKNNNIEIIGFELVIELALSLASLKYLRGEPPLCSEVKAVDLTHHFRFLRNFNAYLFRFHTCLVDSG